MPADRLLGTLLRSLRTYTDQQDTPRLLSTAASLLTTLNNPLNVTLLASQLLSAPAIWAQPDGLRTCMRCLSVFHTAAQALTRHDSILQGKLVGQDFGQLQLERTLPKDDWIRAVINGLDEHSLRWRHLLPLGGLLLGFSPTEDGNISRSMRGTIEGALTKAANAALEETPEVDELGQAAMTVVLNHCFPIMSDYERTSLNYDLLLPALLRSTFRSTEGLRSAYFLGAIDLDVQPISRTQLHWPERSPSYQQLQSMLASPLLTSLGPLSRLIGHSIESTKDAGLVVASIGDLEDFCRTLHAQWRMLKLSHIDSAEESTLLDRESLEKTTPALWRLLRSTMYAVVIVLRSAIRRLLGDGALARDLGSCNPSLRPVARILIKTVAPRVAANALHVLRHLYFITTRLSAATSAQYVFVNLTALDILTTYPEATVDFLRSIRPVEFGRMPSHPLDRCLDLFFLNTAEHCTLALSPQTTEELLVAAAAPYLATIHNKHLLPIFEAAHSVMLAAFCEPQNVDLTGRHLPFYVDTLFKAFPSNVSARQFRLAFRTLLQLTTPPAVISAAQPMLSATLLELLYERARHASTDLLSPQRPSSPALDSPEDMQPLSEQAVLILTILDTLPLLPLELLTEWLVLSADLVNSVGNPFVRDHCKKHLWDTIIKGEMDPDRSTVCHAWWTTASGQNLLLYADQPVGNDEAEMSGALYTSGESKL